ncbi:hypothetical protein DKX38_019830 [Salix brachista]|uniref:Uncharacterized protein n=1 Tax=Salix brachista TaxID=2182728 RepID=A0A5N5KHA8_9ROSI|nr:hypothetical protein DKX38_019830 [Salix brachista]
MHEKCGLQGLFKQINGYCFYQFLFLWWRKYCNCLAHGGSCTASDLRRWGNNDFPWMNEHPGFIS